MNVTDIKAAAYQAVDDLQPEAVAIAKDLHANPELGWDTPRSAGLLIDYQEKHGLRVERGVAGLAHAFRGSIPGREGQRPGVAMLAEYDALPELGHACSHNLIGTIAATAGIAVGRALPADIAGNVYVMGCPFEEGGGGKLFMLEAGVFDVTDTSLMWHGANRVQVGSPNIAAGMLTFTFHGRPAHTGTSPHKGINAADAAMLTFAGMNALRQHVTSDVRISGIITDGGDAINIVPARSEVRIMVRGASHLTLGGVIDRVKDCARGAAIMTGARLEVEEAPLYAERLIVQGMRRVMLENLRAIGVEAPDDDPQTYASADSGNVSQVIPHVSYNLPLDDIGSVPHTAEFAAACNTSRAWEALNLAAKAMAGAAIDLITDPERVASIKREHGELRAKAVAAVA